MNRCRFFRHAMVALVPAAAISLGLGNVLAQTPPPAPPAVTTPAPRAGACPIRNSRPGATGNPGSGSQLPGRAGDPACYG